MDKKIICKSEICEKNEVKEMREGIHPKYYQATVTCNCGNTFVVGSTKKDIHVEICSKMPSVLQASRRRSRPADVSKHSTRSSVWATYKSGNKRTS